MQNFLKNQKFIFFLLTLALGIFLFFPYHNFQLHLAQGDHGRDLYCFKKTLDGAVPYRDYWWVYGPLMPYYYAAFYKLLDTNIHSVLLGYHLWDILCGLAVFGILSTFFTSILALTGAVWYWIFFPPFEYTYNHAGGIFSILLTIYFLAAYLKKGEIRYLYGGLAAIFALFFIKLNFGLSMLAGFVLSITLIDYVNKISFAKKKLFYFMSLLSLPFLVGVIYYGFVRELPLYYIRQCFPYFGADRPFNPTIGEVIKSFFDHSLLNPNSHWTNWLMVILSGISFLYIIIRWKKLATDKAQQKQFILLMVALIVISLFNLHEFLLSAVYYRTSWVKPSHIVAMFALIAFALDNIPRIGKWFVCVLILCSAFHGHYMRSTFVSYLKVPFQFINLPRGQVFIGNAPPWLDTVTKATEHLTATLGENETFLAVVDDPLYYFLAEKDSPTRQLAFCNHLNIHINQELEIISKLENDNINYVLLSNKAFLKDNYMGTFGVTYCPLLAAYIRDNFSLSMSFGDWNQEPSWYAGHAVMILKRK